MATTPQDISKSPLLSYLKANLTIEIPEFNEVFEEPKQKQTQMGNRCCHGGCKKKLSLTDFPCKCGKKHCAAHRIPEVHSCSYDFKQSQRDILLKTMSTAVCSGARPAALRTCICISPCSASCGGEPSAHAHCGSVT
jgi:hypothetical protein